MNRYEADVASQPESIRSALRSMTADMSSDEWRDWETGKWKKVVFAGMGSSHFVCHGAVIYLNERGIDAQVLSASQLLHYERGLLRDDTLLVLVSQSGESAEIVRLLELLPPSFDIVAITNEPTSRLAAGAQRTLQLYVEQEASVTTRTYVASFVAVHLLARRLEGSLDLLAFEREIEGAADKMALILKESDMHAKLDAFLTAPAYVCLIGRGHALSTVRAGALFIREVAKFPALDFEAAEFRHGPMEMVDEQFAAIVLAPTGVTGVLNRKLAWDIVERGGKVVLVTNEPCDDVHPQMLVINLPNVDECLSPLLDVIPVQRVANLLAEQRQLEVGTFRWSSKVTNTE
ncbi:SIS domain-containing protein [Paenibacillus sp. MAH-36]|uniref:Glutamine--fructose-6-phosphate aminotransferase [isomerizing] n=1 Tax=Paenibacillus violae TaxID=3077234 RepID=A0ABU3RPZ6_9BACL|nr:SIS domain-containing protein [Paenibacillus sp. PFR10]MDU0206350.1 SIS domain-containing protein [Paenibacillus sp. PFR10]